MGCGLSTCYLKTILVSHSTARKYIRICGVMKKLCFEKLNFRKDVINNKHKYNEQHNYIFFKIVIEKAWITNVT